MGLARRPVQFPPPVRPVPRAPPRTLWPGLTLWSDARKTAEVRLSQLALSQLALSQLNWATPAQSYQLDLAPSYQPCSVVSALHLPNRLVSALHLPIRLVSLRACLLHTITSRSCRRRRRRHPLRRRDPLPLEIARKVRCLPRKEGGRRGGGGTMRGEGRGARGEGR